MIEGDAVTVRGRVQNKFNMDVHGTVLRVVSGNSWSSTTNTNHVETFDASDIHNLKPIDHATFGDNEDLYATLFMEEAAFFVTYRRVDPFHAFEVTPQGMLDEKSEFIVSGWNDYFRPVSAKTRLIGIGKNDENGRSTMAVSLYDITDLTNPNPLITRAEVALDRSWSEAQWDDRAFSVLEKATSVPSADGTATETGLVLLPFSGWNDTEKRYVSAVQIYTFSKDTLTLRGVMDHGTRVRRSFMAERTSNTTGNLSEAELSLFDTTDPDNPVEQGRIELAPNYANLEIFGAYGVRHHDRSSYYGWWGNYGQDSRNDSLQVVPLSKDVDRAKPVATIDIPAQAQTHRVGDLLVSVHTTFEQHESGDYTKGKHVSDIEVWDLSDPTTPELASSFTTDRIEPGGYYGGGYWGDCWDCRYWYGNYGANVTAVGDTLVFDRRESQEELQGTVAYRRIYPDHGQRRYDRGCYTYEDGEYEERACTYLSGGIRCSTLTRVDGTVEPEVCTGELVECTQNDAGATDCVEVDPDAVATRTYESEYDQVRRWSNYRFDILDVTDPTAPAFTSSLTMPRDEESVGLVADGDTLWVNYKRPHDVADDSRPYVRYFVKGIDLSDPGQPGVTGAINVPGELLFAQGDRLITQDFLWGSSIIEASINKLELFEGTAYQTGSPHRFTDRQVEQVVLDGAGHALVSHFKAYYANYDEHHRDYEDFDYTRTLSMLDITGADTTEVSSTQIDDWASLKDARQGRALYQVPGGLLVVNLDDPTNPYAQAYFPTRGWPQDLTVHDGAVYFSAGRYGLYTFGLDESNITQLGEEDIAR